MPASALSIHRGTTLQPAEHEAAREQLASAFEELTGEAVSEREAELYAENLVRFFEVLGGWAGVELDEQTDLDRYLAARGDV